MLPWNDRVRVPVFDVEIGGKRLDDLVSSKRGLRYLVEKISYDEEIGKFDQLVIDFRWGPELGEAYTLMSHSGETLRFFGGYQDEDDLTEMMIGFIQKVKIHGSERSVKITAVNYLGKLAQGEKQRSLEGKTVRQAVETILHSYSEVQVGYLDFADFELGGSGSSFQSNQSDLEYLQSIAEAFGMYIKLEDSGTPGIWQISMYKIDYSDLETQPKVTVLHPRANQQSRAEYVHLKEFDPESNIMGREVDVNIVSVNPLWSNYTTEQITQVETGQYTRDWTQSMSVHTDIGPVVDMDEVKLGVATVATVGGMFVDPTGLGVAIVSGGVIGSALWKPTYTELEATQVDISGQISGGFEVMGANTQRDVAIHTNVQNKISTNSWDVGPTETAFGLLGATLLTGGNSSDVAEAYLSDPSGYGELETELGGDWVVATTRADEIQWDDPVPIMETVSTQIPMRRQTGTFVTFTCFGETTTIIFSDNVNSDAAKARIEQGILDGNGVSFIVCQGAELAEGNANFKIGQKREILLNDYPLYGQAFSGDYLITKTTHIFSRATGYVLKFNCNKNSIVIPPPPARGGGVSSSVTAGKLPIFVYTEGFFYPDSNLRLPIPVHEAVDFVPPSNAYGWSTIGDVESTHYWVSNVPPTMDAGSEHVGLGNAIQKLDLLDDLSGWSSVAGPDYYHSANDFN